VLLDSLIPDSDLHNNRTLVEVLEQLDDIMPTLSTIKADHLLSHLITASHFVTCTQMSHCGSDSPNIVHPQPQSARKKIADRRLNLEQLKQAAGPAMDVALCDLYFSGWHFSSNLKVGCAGRLITSLELLLSCDLVALLTARLQEATPWLQHILLSAMQTA
jgi:hypothetical protein